MSKFIKRFTSLRGPGLPLVLLLLPVGLYFFYYVPNQQTSCTNRNFRLLSVLSDQLKAKIENAPTALKNLAGTAENPEKNAVVEQIASSITLYPSLILIGVPQVATNTIPGSNSNDAVSLNVESDANTYWLKFRYKGAAGTNTNTTVTIEAKSDLNNLIGSQPEFDGLVIAQAEGPVIFQRCRAGWKFLRLDRLTDRNGRKLETNLLVQASFMTDVRLGKTDYKMFLQPLILSSVSSAEKTNQWWVCGLVESERFREESWAISHIYLVWFLFLMLFCVISLPFLKIRLMGSREKLSKGDVFSLAFASLFGTALTSLLFLHLFTEYQSEATLDEQLLKFSTNIQTHVTNELARMHRQVGEFRNSGTNGHKEGKYLGHSNWLFLTNVLANAEIVPDFPTNDYPFFIQTLWINKEGDTLKRWTIKKISSPFISLKERSYFRDAAARRHSLYEFNLNDTNFWVEPVLSWATGEGSVVLSTFDSVSNQVIMIESKLLSLINPVVPFGYGYCVTANDGQVLFHSDSSRNRENLLTECDNDRKLGYALAGGINDSFDVQYQGKKYSFFVSPLAGSSWSLVVFRNEHISDSVMFDIFLISSFLFFFYVLVLGLIWLSYRLRRGQWLNWLWPVRGRSPHYRKAARINGVIALISFLAIAVVSGPWLITLIGVAAAGLGIMVFCRCQNFPETGAPEASKDSAQQTGSFDSCPQTDPSASKTSVSQSEPPDDPSCYVWVLVSFLFLLAALPAYAFFKSAYDVQMELFVKYGQLHLSKGLQERVVRVENEYRLVVMASESSRKDFLNERLKLVQANLALDVYDSFFFETHCTDDGHAEGDDNKTNNFAGFEKFLGSLRPLHYLTGLESYGGFRDKAVDSSFHWEWETNSPAIWTFNSPKQLLLHKEGFREGRLLHISSKIPPLNFRAWRCLGLLLVLVVLYYAVQFMARWVFLLDIGPEPRIDLAEYIPLKRSSPNLLILKSSRGKNDGIPSLGLSSVIDLQKSSDVELWRNYSIGGEIPPRVGDGKTTPEGNNREGDAAEAAPVKSEFITIKHFEYRCDDSQFNEDKLKLIEKLLFDRQKTLVIISAIDPSNFCLPDRSAKAIAIPNKAQPEPPCEQRPPTHEVVLSPQRWADVLQWFRRVHIDEDTNRSASSRNTQDHTVHYWSIWAICSYEDRVALHQVAKNRFINKNFPGLPRLLGRGLIVRKPYLKLMNPTFEEFVRRAFRPEELNVCSLAEKDSKWNQIKGPAKTALLMLAILLFLTQQELFDSVVKIVVAFTGALPKLLDFFNLFKKDAAVK